jgi:hypothetical protein
MRRACGCKGLAAGNGAHSFMLIGASSDGTIFATREPWLVVTTIPSPLPYVALNDSALKVQRFEAD